jgi:hypothetical protein
MNETQMGHGATVAAVIPEPPEVLPRLLTRVIVNRLPGSRDWRPGVAATLEPDR